MLSDRTRSDLAMLRCLIGLVGLCMAPGVYAQDMTSGDEAISVQKRSRPDYDPIPMHIGTFQATVSSEARVGYDDNIYANSNSSGLKVDDAIASLDASASIRSNWTRHQVSLDVDAGISRGLSQRNEDTEVYDSQLKGQFDIGAQTKLSAHAGYARAYEPRGSVGDTTVRGPRIAYNTLDVGADLDYTSGRLLLGAQVQLETYRYAPYNANGVTIQPGSRNYRSWNTGLSAGYAIAPGIAAIIQGNYNQASYPDDTAQFDRTSKGWSLRGGLAFGVTRLIRGRAGIGWQSQKYDDPVFPRISGLDFDAALEWNPTNLLTWTLEARRTIQRSPIVGVAGIRQSRYGSRLDYEARRNVILWGRLDRTVNEFAGTGRSQTDMGGSLGADWLVNRRLRFSAQGGVQYTNSRGLGGRTFDRNRVSVTVRYTL